MAVKLVLGLLALAFIISVAVIATFWYFTQRAKVQAELEKRRMEQTEAIFESEDLDSEIDRELERGKR